MFRSAPHFLLAALTGTGVVNAVAAAVAAITPAIVARCLILGFIVMSIIPVLNMRGHAADGSIMPTGWLIDKISAASEFYSEELLKAFAMLRLMSRKGECRDNAVTEALFGSLKVERLHGMLNEQKLAA